MPACGIRSGNEFGEFHEPLRGEVANAGVVRPPVMEREDKEDPRRSDIEFATHHCLDVAPAGALINFAPLSRDLRPWLHDFAPLGPITQQPGS